MNEYFVIILLMTFFAAGVVKGLTGMGLPTVAIGIFSLFIALPAAAAMIIIPSFVTYFWPLFTGPSISRLLKKTLAPGVLHHSRYLCRLVCPGISATYEIRYRTCY